MKKSIIVGLVMASVMVFGNTLLSGGTGTNVFSGVNPYMGLTTGLSCAIGSQVSNYCLTVTNYAKTYKTIGNRPTGCNQMGCLVYHCEPIHSDTEYAETETVNKKTMLSYDVSGIRGETCIKDEVVSKRKREVNSVSIMKTNDWEKVEEVSWENTRGYFSVTNTIYNAITNMFPKIVINSTASILDPRAMVYDIGAHKTSELYSSFLNHQSNKITEVRIEAGTNLDYIKKDMIHSPSCPCKKSK